ncbi:hypothetical protein HCN44_007745 [Aphidius gifuensis]|uniref:Uncharacterized protein n=1 Tax=Aphidius gifuensis TaxID=684658 RepID=A0A834XPS3_APHGI|nr:hypothetical protein HCN44_007745 [Aphidius gifuensis]
MGKKTPTLMEFLNNWHNIITVEAQNMEKNFRVHRQTNKVQSHSKNQLILDSQENLTDGIINVKEFLYEVMSQEKQESIMKFKYWEMENPEKKEELKILAENKTKIITPPEESKPDYGKKKRKKRNSKKETNPKKVKKTDNNIRPLQKPIDASVDTVAEKLDSTKEFSQAIKLPPKKSKQSINNYSEKTLVLDQVQPSSSKNTHINKSDEVMSFDKNDSSTENLQKAPVFELQKKRKRKQSLIERNFF